MNNFIQDVVAALFFFLIGFIIGVIKAYLSNSPISKTEEIINYHHYLKWPVFWSIVSMFFLIFIFGLLMNSDLNQVLQKATIASLYTGGAVYIFMIWGANLIKNK